MIKTRIILLFATLALLGSAYGITAKEALPPPTSGGTFDIEAVVASERFEASWQYQPSKPYVILAEQCSHHVAEKIVRTPIPPSAGSTTTTFMLDRDYSSRHPEVASVWTPWSWQEGNAVIPDLRFVLKTAWDQSGRASFSLSAKVGAISSLIEGLGTGGVFSKDERNLWPIPLFFVDRVTKTEGKVGWFSWWYGLRARHLPDIQRYWTETQADGRRVVFNEDYLKASLGEVGRFIPLGELVTVGTPGHEAGFEVTTEPLTESAAEQALRAEEWKFAGTFQPWAEPTAFYAFSSSSARASKLRYKLQIQPGLARTILWAETFTPDGAAEPANYRFVSEEVEAEAVETSAHEIDPFQRFGARPGIYRILAFEAESFNATLTADVNRDGALLPAGGALTDYVIANADAATAARPYVQLLNGDDDDEDGQVDCADTIVNGAGDVADFFPVFLNIKQLLTTFPPGSGAVFRLSQADSAVNFVYSDLTRADAFSYLNDERDYGYGPELDQPLARATVVPVTAAGVELSVDFLYRIRDQGRGVILVEARAASTAPLMLTVETATGTAVVRLPLQAIAASLAVDANRDGEIRLPSEDSSDETSTSTPFRFWINDDDDVDDDDPDDSENAPVSTADYTDDKIDGIRDLEDFSRLKIYLGGLQDAVLQGQIQIGLKWKDTTGSPSLKVWRNLSPNGGTEYLTDVAVARQHLTLRGPGLVQGTTRYIIPTQYWQDVGLSSLQPYGNLLFEGCTVGKGQLVITLHKADGTVIGEGPGVWIDLKNIKSMYERVKAAADGTENFPFPYNHVGSDPVPTPAMAWTPDPNGFPFESDPGESATYIVSVHGWNQTYERSTMYAETMLKRMWHRGYKGRFVCFRWPTFTGLTTYNDSEYRAWKCGVSLNQYLDTIPSAYTVNLVAHSMGNIVAGSALEKGASVANYALLNAAVPAICYDTSGNVVQTSWGYVTPNDDPDSATAALSYQSRLANVSGNLVNFFLPADSALVAWEVNNDTPGMQGRFPDLSAPPVTVLGWGAKPHQWSEGSLETAGYHYQRTASAGQKLRVVRVAGERILASPDEAMGFAVQAPSLTVGADGRTRGAIDDWVDMTAYGFDSVHSAEFLFTIHQTRDFYGTLLLKLGVAVQP